MENNIEKKEFEYKGKVLPGFLVLAIQLCCIIAIVLAILMSYEDSLNIVAVILFMITIISSSGYVMIEPNNVCVFTFFGKYVGTFNKNGFFWLNPFVTKHKLTHRARNLDVTPIKVNDKEGNPIMIGLVLVWRIKDCYKAMFDIDTNGGQTSHQRMNLYQNFVTVQSDAALRNIAGEYAYDNNENQNAVTLRAGGDEINSRLESELNVRLSIAGIEIVEARINYLAYAPEIAAVMLRRQQAAAIISAREKIVEGAVGMVQLAIGKLESENIVELSNDQKASLASNLLVVLCSEEQTQPVVNADSRGC